MAMSAVGMSTREIEDIYKIISNNSHLDSSAIDGLERYVDRIPELHDVVAFYRAGDELRSLQPFAKTYEAMIHRLRENGDESSQTCRQMYSDLSVYEMMRFNNKESQRLWEEAERLAYKYDKDSLSRSIFLLVGAGSPYDKYDLLTGDEFSRDLAVQIINYATQKNIPETITGYDLISTAIQLGLGNLIYIKELDRLFEKAKTIYAREHAGEKIPAHDEVSYLLTRYLWSTVPGLSAVPDFEAKRKACSLVDSIDVYALRQNSINQIIMVCLMTDDKVTARQMARRNVEDAEKDSLNDRHGDFNIMSMHARLRNISCLQETGEPSQAREKAVELLEYYKKHEAPPSVMLYAYGFLLNFFGEEFMQECVEYCGSIDPCVEQIYTLSWIYSHCHDKGLVGEANKTLENARECLNRVKAPNAFDGYLYRVEAEKLAVLGNSELAAERFRQAINAYKNRREANNDLLIYLHYRTINCELGRPGRQSQIKELLKSARQLFDKSIFGVSVYEYLIRLQDIQFSLSGNKKLSAMLKLFNQLKKEDNRSIASVVSYDIGSCYFSEDDPVKAAEYYEYCYSVESSEDTWNDANLISCISQLSQIYNLTGNYARRREIMHGMVEFLDQGKLIPNVAVLGLLGQELGLEVANGNTSEAYFYFQSLSRISRSLKENCNNDPVALARLESSYLHKEIVYWNALLSQPENPQKANARQCIKNISEIISYLLPVYETHIGIDEGYNNLVVAKARAIWALDHNDSGLNDFVSATIQKYESGGYNYLSQILKTEFSGLRMTQGELPVDQYLAAIDMTEDDCLEYIRKHRISMVTASGIIIQLLSKALVRDKDFEKSESLCRMRFDMVRDEIRNKYGTLSEDERIGMNSSGVTTPFDIHCLLDVYPVESMRKLSYDAALFYKNLMLENNNRIRGIVYKSGNESAISLYNGLQNARKAICSLNIDSKEREDMFMVQRRNINKLEDSLYRVLPQLAATDIRRSTNWNDVAKKLGVNEAAIEFVKVADGYGALVLRNKAKSPEYVKLISDSLMASILPAEKMNQDDVRMLYTPGGTRATRNNHGHILYDNLWKPLEKHLLDVDIIYYCPTGQLSALQFAAITDSSRTALCERYDLRLVSSTAQVVERKKGRRYASRPGKLMLVGDVRYESGMSGQQANRNWHPLSHSISEIDSVAHICNKSKNIVVVDRKTRHEASERWFRTLSGYSPDMILFSTHGFFLNAKDAARNKYLINKQLTNDSIPNMNIPSLWRGGIILSGANPVWNNETTASDENDGILTAAEIADLDLSSTDIVILSACETGQGDPTLTEGVNGLQRGFKLSGVDTVVMSLWEVNDLAGQKFIQEFFSRLADDVDRHKAFREAQILLKRQYPRDPFMWAPFVMLD